MKFFKAEDFDLEKFECGQNESAAIQANAKRDEVLEKAIEVIRFYSKCQCDAKWSGVDEARHLAKGCPRCQCDTGKACEFLKGLE